MEILCVEEKGEFVGILISSFSKDLVLIEYFAINPNQRGGGIGSKVLQLVKKRYQGRRIMLEIETPDGEEIKARREEFYKRNGFQLLTLDELLRTKPIEDTFTPDGALYLRLVLTDQRTMNIRNLICHGIVPPHYFNSGIAARLLHVLIILGMVRDAS